MYGTLKSVSCFRAARSFQPKYV
jgi:hypothetical protein